MHITFHALTFWTPTFMNWVAGAVIFWGIGDRHIADEIDKCPIVFSHNVRLPKPERMVNVLTSLSPKNITADDVLRCPGAGDDIILFKLN